MKEQNIAVLDADDYVFIERLRNIGIERKIAAVLAFFRERGSGTSREMEMATSMHQPEVSIAIGVLKKLGFINEEQVKLPHEGRGRQYTSKYSLAVSFEDVLKHFWGMELQRWEEKMDAYKKLLNHAIHTVSD